MVGQEPGEYRPRRAYIPEPESADSEPGPHGDDDTRVVGPPVPGLAGGEAEDPSVLPHPVAAEPARRGRLALIIAAVVAVVGVGLGIGYAVLGLEDPAETTGAPPAPATSASSSTGAATSTEPRPDASSTVDPGEPLADSAMLSTRAAAKLDEDRNWKVALTQRGLAEDSPQPTCLGGEPGEGQPVAQQTVLRLLSSGKQGPGLLHQATAYESAEEAAQAYAVAAETLGGCVQPGASIEAGARITGLGDQALGQIVQVVDGDTTEFHTLVLSRTGRVLDVVDVARRRSPVAVDDLAGSVATVISEQCRVAGGRCAKDVSVEAAPPHLGGDQPGFLAAGDLPAVGPEATVWAGDPPHAPEEDFTGSQCETVTWADVSAEKRAHRTYFQESSATNFGVDELVLTRKDEAAATKLARQIRDDLASCEDRQLTATVADLTRLRGEGAQGTEIAGWATTVSQKADEGTTRFRVGVVSAGPKVVFTFANPQKGVDFTDQQWNQLTVRAGERATQVK